MKSPARPACRRIADSLIDGFARAIATLTTLFLPSSVNKCYTGFVLPWRSNINLLQGAHTIESVLFYLSLHIWLIYAADGKMSAEKEAIFHHSESVKGKAEIAFFE